MKNKLSFLLLIAGGVLAALRLSAFAALPAPAVAVAGGFLLGFSYLLFNSVYAGTVWGGRIKSSGAGSFKQIFGAVGLVIGGFSLVYTGLELFVSLFAGEIVYCLVLLLCFAVPLAVGPLLGKVFSERTLARDRNALVLGNYPLFQELDAELGRAAYFVVSFEGVALFSEADYCYAVYPYEDYQLGTLTTPAQVALVGTYFVQRYSKTYTYKVDVEVIPGEPGRTVVAVGTGGIGVARVQGTPYKRLFRSYIFQRKRS